MKKVLVFAIEFVICLIAATVIAALGGCATTDENSAATKEFFSGFRPRFVMFNRNVPVPPPRVGFNRPPVHWDESLFSFRIINETRKAHVRCLIDGEEHRRTVRGKILWAYVRTEQGLKLAALIPPGEDSYLIFDGERHTMKCELYAGPVQILPRPEEARDEMRAIRVAGDPANNKVYIFKKIAEKYFRAFLPHHFPDRIYKINKLSVLTYDRM